MDSQQSKPYDRQPTDTDKSWAAFCMYRDMGGERSLEKLGQKIGKRSCRFLYQWCSKHKWVERCRTFDNEELEKRSIALRQLRLDRQRKMEEDAWKRRDKLILKADYIVRIPVTKKETIKSEDGTTNIYTPTDKWSISDAIKFYRYADELGIFATGGDRPNMTEIDAVKVLAQAGLLPAEILDAAERGSDALKSILAQAFQNLNKPVSDS
jgi:hypothetical protein